MARISLNIFLNKKFLRISFFSYIRLDREGHYHHHFHKWKLPFASHSRSSMSCTSFQLLRLPNTMSMWSIICRMSQPFACSLQVQGRRCRFTCHWSEPGLFLCFQYQFLGNHSLLLLQQVGGKVQVYSCIQGHKGSQKVRL